MTTYTTIAIIWGGSATALGIVACWHSEYQKRWKEYWRAEARDCLQGWGQAEVRLRTISEKRHNSAKRARAAQIAQRAAKVAQTTALINRELGR